MVDFQTLLAIIPTLILIASLFRDWWKEKHSQEIEKEKIELEQSKLSRANLESDYARCRDDLRDARVTLDRLTNEGIQKSDRIEQLEMFIRLLGQQIPNPKGG